MTPFFVSRRYINMFPSVITKQTENRVEIIKKS